MAYHQHQPCDTYFVEPQDAVYHQQARQDYLKMIGRRRQQELADELSNLASDTYLADIVDHMKQMEVNIYYLDLVDAFANRL